MPTSVLATQVGGSHYSAQGIQPIEYIRSNNLNFFEGNAVKYVTRHSSKNGKEDIMKAVHYLQMILEFDYNTLSKVTYKEKEHEVDS